MPLSHWASINDVCPMAAHGELDAKIKYLGTLKSQHSPIPVNVDIKGHFYIVYD